MARKGPVAFFVGVIAGSWNVLAYLGSCHSSTLCSLRSLAPADLLGEAYAALSVLLVLVSLASMFGPKPVFYVSAIMALLVDVTEAAGYANVATGPLVVTLALTTLSAVVSLIAAREGTGVSEQSHPLNLPVFG